MHVDLGKISGAMISEWKMLQNQLTIDLYVEQLSNILQF